MVRPVRSLIDEARSCVFSASQKGAVRRHCQITTGPTGRPVAQAEHTLRIGADGVEVLTR